LVCIDCTADRSCRLTKPFKSLEDFVNAKQRAKLIVIATMNGNIVSEHLFYVSR
jgi:hypothetical protein